MAVSGLTKSPWFVACVQCGKDAERRSRKARLYCSDDCYSERKRLLRTGKAKKHCRLCNAELAAKGLAKWYCASCKPSVTKVYTREYYAANADVLKCKGREMRRAARLKDREAHNARAREWGRKHRDAINAKRRTPEYREKAKARVLARYHSDHVRALHVRVSSGIRLSLGAKTKRGKRWEALVGYTTQELAAHLERQFLPGMSWKNMSKWHIDHIVPRREFSIKDENDPEFRACWALTNLRPIWAHENQAKSGKRLHLL